ncbi:MAG: hypothetical protein EBZ45_07700, partial [Actinobacteria bacterium]|nr:hypothetical protein [Actinomycetota bacterium]
MTSETSPNLDVGESAVNRRRRNDLAKILVPDVPGEFFNEINFKKHQGLIRGKADSFEVCAAAVVEQQKYKVKSAEMSAESAQTTVGL